MKIRLPRGYLWTSDCPSSLPSRTVELIDVSVVMKYTKVQILEYNIKPSREFYKMYSKVFDEAILICVSENECGVKPSYSTSTTYDVGDLKVTNNCMSYDFECNEDNIFKLNTCYSNGFSE
uniref:ZP domain-containing protein n=1 Tax=Strongyloides papillosus TaxID=174720 RepID=A0A0N5CIL7_STREA